MVRQGRSNQLSILSGLESLSGHISDGDFVVVHDGIRPLVNPEVICDAINTCKQYGNAVSVIPSNEAMLYSEDSLTSNSSLDRWHIWKTQTPHVMPYREMLNLVKRTMAKGKTDSVAICTMLIEDGQQVHFSKGNNANFKITNPEDLALFKAYLSSVENR